MGFWAFVLFGMVLPSGEANAARLDSSLSGSITVVRGVRPAQPNLSLIGTDSLISTTEMSTAGLVANLPGVQVSQNSRGEAVFSIRGSQERQAAVYQDGAPLALPWDQRTDLSMFPAFVVSKVELVRGSPSVLYGPWGAGGVANLIVKDPLIDSNLTQAEVSGGMGGAYALNASALRHNNQTGVFVAAGWFGRDATTTADASKNSSTPVSDKFQESSQYRINSDLKSRWSMGKARFQGDEFEGGITVSAASGEKGVPPSGHEADSPRFWRYPEWGYLRVVANGKLRSGALFGANGAIWVNRFHQVIDKYTDSKYSYISAQENGDDLDVGGRVAGQWAKYSGFDVSFAAQGSLVHHNQVDAAVDTSGSLISGTELQYKQAISSIGAEFGWTPVRRFRFELGLAWDGGWTLEAGDKEANPDQSAYGVTGSVEWRPRSQVVLHVAAGQRSRFPSLRELYGDALKTFMPNPDLNPEILRTMDVAATWNSKAVQLQGAVFIRQTEGLIDQIKIADPNAPKKSLRKRVNLGDCWTRGGEFQIGAEPVRWMSISGNVLLQDAWVNDSLSKSYTPQGYLTKTPTVMAGLKIGFRPTKEVSMGTRIQYRGKAWDRHPDPTVKGLVSLGTSLKVDVFSDWLLPVQIAGIDLKVQGSIENMFDVPSQLQLGFPEPGRTVGVKLKMSM